jgi:hypothetical protein
VLEAVSVIVQVISFKLTGKRVFRMAPLHHHFEQKGWTEPQIVIRFWIISIVLALRRAARRLKLRMMIPVTDFRRQEGRACSASARSGSASAQRAARRRRRRGRRGTIPSERREGARAGIPSPICATSTGAKIAALVLAPGVPLTHPAPHWTVGLARNAAVEVIGDIELFCRERRRPRPMRRSSPSPAPTASRPPRR